MTLVQSMARMTCLVILLSSVSGYSTETRVYRTVNEDGIITFSELPTNPDAEVYDVRSISVLESRVADRTDPQGGTGEEGAETNGAELTGYYQVLRIDSPRDQSSIPLGRERVFDARVVVRPRLQADHQVRFTLNGESVGEGRSMAYRYVNVRPGSHTVGASVIGPEGESIFDADAVVVFIE